MLGFNFMLSLLGKFLFLAVFLSAPLSWGEAVRTQLAGDSDIYAQPNFSSRKIERVGKGTVVIVRTEKQVGAGGMGVFYKIKTPSGKIGYVTDSDLTTVNGKIKVVTAPPPPAKTPPPPPKQAQASPVPAHLIDTPEAEKKPGPKPQPAPAPAPSPPVSRPSPPPQAAAPELAEKPKPASHSSDGPLWGLSAAAVQYSEKIRGKAYSDLHVFVGARRTGHEEDPTAWRSDMGFLFTVGAPRFLAEAGAYGETSGYIFLADYLFLKPFIVKDNFSLFGAAGPYLAYSSYKTNFDDGAASDSSFRPGAVLAVGGTYGILGNKYLRADLKVIIESTFYFAQTITFQFPL
jgi:hypothetical protein